MGTKYAFVPNGCVVNIGLGAAHDGAGYFNSGAGKQYEPYKGRSIVCKVCNAACKQANPTAREPVPLNQTAFEGFKCKPSFAVKSANSGLYKLSFPSYAKDRQAYNFDHVRKNRDGSGFVGIREMVVNPNTDAAKDKWWASTDRFTPDAIQFGCFGVDGTQGLGTFAFAQTVAPITEKPYAIGPNGDINFMSCSSRVLNVADKGITVTCEVHKEILCKRIGKSEQCFTQKRCNCLQNCGFKFNSFIRWTGFGAAGMKGHQLCEKACIAMG